MERQYSSYFWESSWWFSTEGQLISYRAHEFVIRILWDWMNYICSPETEHILCEESDFKVVIHSVMAEAHGLLQRTRYRWCFFININTHVRDHELHGHEVGDQCYMRLLDYRKDENSSLMIWFLCQFVLAICLLRPVTPSIPWSCTPHDVWKDLLRRRRSTWWHSWPEVRHQVIEYGESWQTVDIYDLSNCQAQWVFSDSDISTRSIVVDVTPPSNPWL